MISFPLTLRLAPAPVHSPTAWFIPGDDPQGWLEEILHWWGTPAAKLRFFVVPASVRDRSPIGVLVRIEGNLPPTAVLRAQPYGLLGDRLFVPVDAVLEIPVSDSELRQKLPLDLYVMHPSAGLIGFAQGEALGVADLLRAPPPRASNWECAATGTVVSERLISVEPSVVPGIDEVLDTGKEDIGSEARDVYSHPPRGSGVKQAAKWVSLPPLAIATLLGLGSLKILGWLSNQLPAKPASKAGKGPSKSGKGKSGQSFPGTPAWMLRAQSRMGRALRGLARDLLDMRGRELERLKRLLEKDPDEGLRYALPLRDMGTRGRAAPGSKLGKRDLSFNLSKLFAGGQAGDPWNIPPDLHWALQQQYRQAAGRELRLGRYRRAAYIFAHLLGEFGSAANALEQGRAYREAAVLYRDKLNNRRKAAECLEHGGLLSESIPIYEELKMFEKAGDLYRALEHHDQAARSYRTQVAGDFARSNFLEAARLLEKKLDAPDEALAALTIAWPDADAAGSCLNESFSLLARLARHDETINRIQKLRSEAAPAGRGAALTRVLAEVGAKYPDATARARSADATRVVAGKLLAIEEIGDQRTAIARSVAQLAPQDRLLSRDVERFLKRRETRSRTPAPITRKSTDPVVLRRFSLDSQVTWKAVAAEGQEFYAIGRGDGFVMPLRGLWDGRNQTILVRPKQVAWPEWLWTLCPMVKKGVIVTMPTFEPALPFALPPNNLFSTKLEFRLPSWLNSDRLMAVANYSDVTYALYPNSLTAYDSNTGFVIATSALPPGPPPNPVQMIARSKHVYVTWNNAILIISLAGSTRIDPMPRPVRGLAASALHTRLRIVVAFDEGGRVIWEHGDAKGFGEGLFEFHVTFTRGGILVAADDHRGRIYSTEGGDLRQRGEFAGAGPSTIAITATNRIDEFATFTSDGMVTVYKVPA